MNAVRRLDPPQPRLVLVEAPRAPRSRLEPPASVPPHLRAAWVWVWTPIAMEADWYRLVRRGAG